MEEPKKAQEEFLLTGILNEFRVALRDEITIIKKSGYSSTILKNGKRIDGFNGFFWYCFQVDYLPTIPADTPCNLFIGGSQYNVTVVRFDESEITVASSIVLPDALANARLDNGATVLLERLIKRIEDNSQKENPAGKRMLINSELNENNGFACIEPNFAVVNDGKETLNQYEAKYSALNNNITYIWGPPGTGKTTVIGNIIKQLYKADRSVLIVSHTNTAVDGAIEKVQDLRRGDDSCPVLRLGIPQRKLSPVVELKNHIRLLGVELFKRQEELKFLRLEKNTRV